MILETYRLDLYNNNFNYHIYYKPLCYQTFPKTKNMEVWDQDLNIILKIMNKFLTNILIPLLNLDKEVQPGFDIVYCFMYIVNILPYLIMIYILYRLMKSKNN